MPGPPAGQHPRFYTNMPAGAATPQRLGTIDPSSLIGRPENIVEPRNVALLSDAFRQGFITADDVISRVGELGKTKEKAELMQAQEAISPEQQALRAQQVAAGTEVAALAEAQAERSQVLQQYPAVAYFDKLAAAAGIQEPKLADGSPDYPQMEKIGAELALHQAQKVEAAAQLENITTQESADGSTLFARTKQGEFVDPRTVQSLRARATKTFERQAPGSAMVSPRTSADTMMNGPAPTAAAQPLVEPRAMPAPAAAPVIPAPSGIPAPGMQTSAGISLGAPATAPAKPIDSVAQAQTLAAAEAVLPVIDTAIAAVDRGIGVGPLEGSGPVRFGNQIAAAFGFREQELKDQRALEIAISNKILEGAQVMKGNLSDKDVRFLQATVPRLSDPEPVWRDYLSRWKQMARLNVDIVSGRVGKPTGDIFSVGWSDNGTAPAAVAAANAPVRVNTPAEAPPTAQFIQAPDGRVFKNPNYRP